MAARIPTGPQATATCNLTLPWPGVHPSLLSRDCVSPYVAAPGRPELSPGSNSIRVPGKALQCSMEGLRVPQRAAGLSKRLVLRLTLTPTPGRNPQWVCVVALLVRGLSPAGVTSQGAALPSPAVRALCSSCEPTTLSLLPSYTDPKEIC